LITSLSGERPLKGCSTLRREEGPWPIIPSVGPWRWRAAGMLLHSDAFYHELSDGIKDKLAARDLPADLDVLISLAIQIDGRLQEWRRWRVLSAVP